MGKPVTATATVTATAPRHGRHALADEVRPARLAFALVRGGFVVFVALALVGGSGCGHAAVPSPPVQPWQREHLARRAMRFDADPLETRFRQHMFGSREGSDLGYGQPGGGCGCN